jgi:hypothetical protein
LDDIHGILNYFGSSFNVDVIEETLERIKTHKDFFNFLSACCFDIKYFNRVLKDAERKIKEKSLNFEHYNTLFEEDKISKEIKIYSLIWKSKTILNDKEVEFFDGNMISFYEKPHFKIRRKTTLYL